MNSPRNSVQNHDHAAQQRDASDDFADCYRSAYPRLVAIAAGVLGRHDGAEDVVQQAAQITIAKRKRFDSQPALVRWLAGVVRHCALNQRRQTKTRKTFASDPAELNVEVLSPAPMQVAVDPRTGRLASGQSDFDDRVLAGLDDLGDDARCCLLLRVVHRLTYTEIHQLTGVPEGTAMSHVHRSKQRLRAALAETPEPENRAIPARK